MFEMAAALRPATADADGWIAHDGSGRPVLAETMVTVRYRNGMEAGPVRADARRWARWDRTTVCDFDIKFYRLEEK